jgi:hypothetical protein
MRAPREVSAERLMGGRMENLMLAGLVALTSIGAYAVGVRCLGLRRAALGPAVGRALECLGLTVAFSAVNFLLGFALILATRAVLRGFLSFYLLDDVVLVILSLVQALVFAWWHSTSAR